MLMDVDGVLTDGRLFHFVDTKGRLVELKGVDTQDGIALTWLARNGIRTGVISGRRSAGFAARARALRMSYVVQGADEKLAPFERILKEARLRPDEAAFIGDDLPDIPVMRRAGWAIAVANARPEVKRAAHTVTKRRGGGGAVREAVELLLKSRGLWEGLVESYRS
ncbi:MAG: HAD family hydrolase [Elusimicrobiota bacterium]